MVPQLSAPLGAGEAEIEVDYKGSVALEVVEEEEEGGIEGEGDLIEGEGGLIEGERDLIEGERGLTAPEHLSGGGEGAEGGEGGDGLQGQVVGRRPQEASGAAPGNVVPIISPSLAPTSGESTPVEVTLELAAFLEAEGEMVEGDEDEEEDEFENFLDLHGLQPYAQALHEFGIELIADFYDEDILSDEDLAGDIGMRQAEIERFRAVLASQPHHGEAL